MQFVTHIAKRIKNATSFIRTTKPLANRDRYAVWYPHSLNVSGVLWAINLLSGNKKGRDFYAGYTL